MRFPTMWYVRLAKPQFSLIRTFASRLRIMSLKLQTEQCLEILSVQGGAQARLSLHLSKCHIVGNHMSRLIWPLSTAKANRGSREFRKGGGSWQFSF